LDSQGIDVILGISWMKENKAVLDISVAATRKDEVVLVEIQRQLKKENVIVDVEATLDSNVTTTFTVHDFGTRGLKAILWGPFLYHNSAKAEFQYLHHLAGITTIVGLNASTAIKPFRCIWNHCLWCCRHI
jgi:aspartokinase